VDEYSEDDGGREKVRKNRRREEGRIGMGRGERKE
jgi:hypothetical protein